jgi:hypothetical protein
MVERCEAAAAQSQVDAEVLDLRTLSPWDKAAVLASVQKTRRCLIVHEDNLTAGFGAEIAATLARDAFFDLDAPIERVTMPDVPSPHSPLLLDAVVPSVAGDHREPGSAGPVGERADSLGARRAGPRGRARAAAPSAEVGERQWNGR